MNGWGERKDLDYWSARSAGLVEPQEQRAMTLLASLSDETRFAFYARYGMFPALGNMSRRVYLVRRFETVLETADGRPVASWCVVTRDRGTIPETDHVVALKNLLEGEEAAFREIGNRGGAYYQGTGNAHEVVKTPFGRVPFKSPYFEGFMDEPGIEAFDPLAHKEAMSKARAAAVARHDAALKAALKKAPGYVEPRAPEIPRQYAGINVAGGMFGAPVTDNSSTAGFTVMGVGAATGTYINNGFFVANGGMLR